MISIQIKQIREHNQFMTDHVTVDFQVTWPDGKTEERTERCYRDGPVIQLRLDLGDKYSYYVVSS